MTSTPASGATRGASARLTVDDWTNRALELLMDEGIGAVKINRLCRDFAVTKGSFYWHFADLEALHKAVAERWSVVTQELIAQMEQLGELPPAERLRALALRLLDDRSWSVERALREWARTDAVVAAANADSERAIFGLVQQCLADLGCDPTQARMRAGLLVYAGIGFAHGSVALPRPTAEDIDDLVAFVSPDP